ncbi:MAG: tetratricopeptide repeat protein [Chloroflexi bacterium]|nr:tetratricopeptide repeat protein [Chloroflexota bacterium]
MSTHGFEDREKVKKDKARKAVALAMNSRWNEAVAVNRSIAQEFPKDLEAFNRLGKALSELGRNREAKEAFQSALEISPNNSIAKKNFKRLKKLSDDETPRPRAPRQPLRVIRNSHTFIEESGKVGLTSLLNLPAPEILLKLTPGDPVQLLVVGKGLRITDSSGEDIGRVEPRVVSRLSRLIRGGNKYDATVTSSKEHELVIIIREVYSHPSQAGDVSFPVRGGAGPQVYLPGTVLGMALDNSESTDPDAVKDWSSDDTEPGDDEAFTPVLHRIISPTSDNTDDEF